MSQKVKYVDEKSQIPIFGLDFAGIIDRGTNIVELKPITICNLHCKYCFVRAGDYQTNFIVSADYLVKNSRKLVEVKGHHDIEIHIAPYGEIFAYKELYNLLESLWSINGVERISMQTNGLLLNEQIIQRLEELNLTRLNISLNTFNEKKAKYLANCVSYDMNSLLKNIESLLETNINVLLAPVWFPGENDSDIEDIIQFVLEKRSQVNSQKKMQIGVQKYLIYKTGRKLKKIRPKTWGYFYQQLAELEEKYHIKLKLGPNDFGIHERTLYSPNLDQEDIIPVKIISEGRWNRECIGKVDENFAVKVLLNSPLKFKSQLIGKVIDTKIIKSRSRDNLITSYLPF